MCSKKKTEASENFRKYYVCKFWIYLKFPLATYVTYRQSKKKTTAANSFINICLQSNFNLQVIFSLIIFCKIDDKIPFFCKCNCARSLLQQEMCKTYRIENEAKISQNAYLFIALLSLLMSLTHLLFFFH